MIRGTYVGDINEWPKKKCTKDNDSSHYCTNGNLLLRGEPVDWYLSEIWDMLSADHSSHCPYVPWQCNGSNCSCPARHHPLAVTLYAGSLKWTVTTTAWWPNVHCLPAPSAHMSDALFSKPWMNRTAGSFLLLHRVCSNSHKYLEKRCFATQRDNPFHQLIIFKYQ